MLSSAKISRKCSQVGRKDQTIGFAEISSVGLMAVIAVQRIGVMKNDITRNKAKYFAKVFTASFFRSARAGA